MICCADGATDALPDHLRRDGDLVIYDFAADRVVGS